MIYLLLFVSFLKVGLFSVGGGYAALPLIQNEVVEHYGWITMQEFTDLITIAEMTPGPIAINAATFTGARIAGILGALISTFGNIFPSCILVSLLAYIYARYRNLSVLQGVLSCLRPAVVALIGAAGFSILRVAAVNGRLLNVVMFAVSLLVLRRWKWNPILVMFLCGTVNVVVQVFFFH